MPELATNEPQNAPKRGPLFLKAVSDSTKSESYIDFNRVRRMDNFEGRMRLACEFDKATVKFYSIPDMKFSQALEKIQRLPGVALIDLSDSDITPAQKSATHAFIKAIRQEDGNARFIRADLINHIESVKGGLNLGMHFKDGETHVYRVGEVDYHDGIQRLQELRGCRFIDLNRI